MSQSSASAPAIIVLHPIFLPEPIYGPEVSVVAQPSTIIPTANQATTFERMPQLPKELQLRIYTIAAHQLAPRSINPLPKLPTNTIPALLLTCLISRIALRKIFSRFGTSVALSSRTRLHYAFFVNLATDTVILDNDVYSSLPYAASVVGLRQFNNALTLFPDMMANVKRLVLTQDMCEMRFEGRTPFEHFTIMRRGAAKISVQWLLHVCPELKKVTIVLGNKNIDPLTAYMSGDVDPTRFIASYRIEIKDMKIMRKKALIGKDPEDDDEEIDACNGEGCKTEIKFQFYRSDPVLGVIRTFDIPVIFRV